MVFSSTIFLFLFLPLVLGIYLLLPGQVKNLFLLLASLVFYAWGEPVNILIMLFSIVFNYSNGIILEDMQNKNRPGFKKAVLVFCIVVNLGLLCFFKYTVFLITQINNITAAWVDIPDIALPIGISFYTFQTLSYIIDVYRGEVKAQHSIIDFGMYISMFPQLIAGPIVKYADIKDQLRSRPLNTDQICQGIYRFVIGLSKKVLIANQIGALWDEISAAGGNIPAATAWLGAFAYALQIYFDFSGYSDMAIGLGKMFGFEFQENFDHPYDSKSITEFWRRWHISLGSWFRDYLYIPLGGNRKGLVRQIQNLFIVWYLTGLWHGASWNFMIWGFYYFIFLVMEKLFLGRFLKEHPIFGHFYTMAVVLISWIIFACEDFHDMGNYLISLVGFHGLADSMSLYYLSNNLILILLGCIASTTLTSRVLARIPSNQKTRTIITVFLYGLSVLMIISDSYNPFLYFRF